MKKKVAELQQRKKELQKQKQKETSKSTTSSSAVDDLKGINLTNTDSKDKYTICVYCISKLLVHVHVHALSILYACTCTCTLVLIYICMVQPLTL